MIHKVNISKKASINIFYNFFLYSHNIATALIKKLGKIWWNSIAKSKYKKILY